MTARLEPRRAARSAPRGTSNGTRAAARVRFARTIRWAIVGSATRKALAISSVVSPPSRRSVSAARASVDSTGWHATRSERQAAANVQLRANGRHQLPGPFLRWQDARHGRFLRTQDLETAS